MAAETDGSTEKNVRPDADGKRPDADARSASDDRQSMSSDPDGRQPEPTVQPTPDGRTTHAARPHARTLVLVRHGKAERRADGVDDPTRSLTQAGSRALTARMPHELSLLDNPGTIVVFTSPALRASQTAVIVADAAGAPEPDELPMLWEQDVDAVASLLLGESDPGSLPDDDGGSAPMPLDLDDSRKIGEADTVVLVGHNPSIEQLVTRLTGDVIHLSTGAACAIKLDGGSEGSLPLLWCVAGPAVARWKNLIALEKVFTRAAETVAERLAGFRESPDDIETLHDVRVSLRTLRSLVSFIQPFQNKKQNARMQDDLRSCVLLTSATRDLDVLCEKVAALETELDAEACGRRAVAETTAAPATSVESDAAPAAAAPAAAALAAAASDGAADDSSRALAYCAGLRDEARACLLERLENRKICRRLDRALFAASHLEWKSPVERDGLGDEDIAGRMDDIWTDYQALARSADYSDEPATHTLRKRAKRVRYCAHALEGLLDEGYVNAVDETKHAQDDLGALCDARLERDLIASLDTASLSPAARWELNLLRAREEQVLFTALCRAQG